MAAVIDLRRDLPKVRKQWPKVLRALSTKKCEYTAPCVIGAMVNPRKRRFLDNPPGLDESTARFLLQAGLLKAPQNQHGDISALQQAFDQGSLKELNRVLKRVEAKYLPVSA